jgi:gluconolactonase
MSRDAEGSRLFVSISSSPAHCAKDLSRRPYTGRVVCGLPGFQRFDSLAVDASGTRGFYR